MSRQSLLALMQDPETGPYPLQPGYPSIPAWEEAEEQLFFCSELSVLSAAEHFSFRFSEDGSDDPSEVSDSVSGFVSVSSAAVFSVPVPQGSHETDSGFR